MTTYNTMQQLLPELDPLKSNMPAYARKVQDNETPFKVIDFGIYTIKLYWSKKGTYGYQVITLVFGRTGFCFARRTNGYGYCKESDTMAALWRVMGYHPRRNEYPHSEINHSYHVGGNYYKVPMCDVMKRRKK